MGNLTGKIRLSGGRGINLCDMLLGVRRAKCVVYGPDRKKIAVDRIPRNPEFSDAAWCAVAIELGNTLVRKYDTTVEIRIPDDALELTMVQVLMENAKDE